MNNNDYLNNLPTDNNIPTQSELKVIDSLFKETNKPNIKPNFLNCILPYIVLLFLIMVISFIPNEQILKIIPGKFKVDITVFFIKAFIVVLIFYLLFSKKISFSSS